MGGGGSRKPNTSCGVVDGSSLHFCATCHFLRITRCKSFRKSVGGAEFEFANFFGLVSFVFSDRLGGGGFLGNAGASCGTRLKLIFLPVFFGLVGGSWKLTLRCICGEFFVCSSIR